MKLVVTIPAYNESRTIADVIREIPTNIEGVNDIEILVVDDGSSDGTRDIAIEVGATRVISHPENRGLASAFRTAINGAIDMDADIIVNTDADMQYDQQQIPLLIQPILEGNADLVLGSRFKGDIEYMSLRKKLGNLAVTFLTRILSGFSTSDAQTGFRAMTRKVANSLIITSDKTYVQETIIRTAKAGYRIVEVPITFRKRDGESRLIRNMWRYAIRVLPDMIWCFLDTARGNHHRRLSEANT